MRNQPRPTARLPGGPLTVAVDTSGGLAPGVSLISQALWDPLGSVPGNAEQFPRLALQALLTHGRQDRRFLPELSQGVILLPVRFLPQG